MTTEDNTELALFTDLKGNIMTYMLRIQLFMVVLLLVELLVLLVMRH